MGDRDPSKAEQESERNSRRLLELLQEVRVATAGVQILFGFLLAVPFQQGFERISSFQRHVYLVVLVCTSLSSALLIAPTALHRLLFRRGHKPEKVAAAIVAAIEGDRAVVPVGVEAKLGWYLQRFAPLVLRQGIARRARP